MAYNTFESNNIHGRNLSFVSTTNIQNGQLLHRGELVTGSKDIYNAVVPTSATLGTDIVFVAGNPAWNYNNKQYGDQNEDAYIIPAGKAFRVYPLGVVKGVPDKYSVLSTCIDFSGVGGTPAVGQYVSTAIPTDGKFYTATTTAPSNTTFVGKIVRVLEMGYEYYVGKNVDTRVTKIMIEVVKNEVVS